MHLFVAPCTLNPVPDLHFKIEQAGWTREHYLQRRLQQVDGTILCVDGSHKLVKLVRVRNQDGPDTRPVHGIITILNEFHQVKCFVDMSHDDRKSLGMYAACNIRTNGACRVQ